METHIFIDSLTGTWTSIKPDRNQILKVIYIMYQIAESNSIFCMVSHRNQHFYHTFDKNSCSDLVI